MPVAQVIGSIAISVVLTSTSWLHVHDMPVLLHLTAAAAAAGHAAVDADMLFQGKLAGDAQRVTNTLQLETFLFPCWRTAHVHLPELAESPLPLKITTRPHDDASSRS